MALASKTFNDADLAALSQLQQSSTPEVAKCVAAEDIANNGKSETQQHLIKMQTEIAELGKALDKYVGPQHDIEVTSTCSRDAIAIVLETTELAEEILSYLDAKNLLVMQEVDQRMRDTIESSMKLQK